MKAFDTVHGRAVPLLAGNIDTDQILPKQFLRTIGKEGLSDALFFDARFLADGTRDMRFCLNRPEYRGAVALVTGPNFGCGSSREHAVWALDDFGIRCLIGTSFGDIFAANCRNNGLLTLSLDEADVLRIAGEIEGGGEVAVNLPAQTITLPSGECLEFLIEPSLKAQLLAGQDAIDLTLLHMAAIEDHEHNHDDIFLAPVELCKD